MIARKMPIKSRIVYDGVRMSILRGLIAPGDMLEGENTLSVSFGVSRVTVRSSLTQLEKEGYLSRLPRKGWKVKRTLLSSKRHWTVSNFVGMGMSRKAVDDICEGLSDGLGEGTAILKNLIPYRSQLLTSDGLDFSKCDAIAYVSGTGIAPEHLENINQRRLPCVNIFFDGRADYDCVHPDNSGAVRKIVDHLLARGRRRMLMISCWIKDPSFDIRSKSFLSLRKKLNFFGELIKIPLNFVGNDDAKGILSCIRRKKIDSVVCVTDVIAKFTLFHLFKAGIPVPAELAVAGFGNDADTLETSLYGINRMTSIGYRHHQLGQIAGKALVNRIASPEMPPVKVAVETELIDGDST